MRVLWLTLAAAFAALALSAPARADDKVKAAEHFERARAAEKREDWRAAIEQYRRAYELAPHPSVLYNLGVNYERAGERREAARHFLRYLEESEAPDDEEQVLARVEKLRKQPSPVEVTVKPEEAILFVDGEKRGPGPQSLRLEAGSHRLYVAHRGRRSSTRQVVCEYGERVEVTLDLNAAPGTLRVDANVSGAEVRLDGEVVGSTPYVDQVAAGDHVVVIRMAGYQPHQQEVSVPAQGSEQIRARLIRQDGAGQEEGGGEGEPAARGFLLGLGYGFDGASGGRTALSLGYRPLDRLEASVLLGQFGAQIGGGGGVETRFFVTTTSLRPYLRAGAVFGDGNAGDGIARFGLEAGLGLLWVGSTESRARFSLEYYLEASAQFATGDDVTTDTTDEEEDPVSFPFLVGVLLRFG